MSSLQPSENITSSCSSVTIYWYIMESVNVEYLCECFNCWSKIDTPCMRLDCYCIHNMMQYKLYLPPLPPAMGDNFRFVGKPICTPAGIAVHKGGLLLHPQQMLCKPYDISDTVQSVPTRFSINCICPCRCVVGGSDSSNNAERSG